MCNTAFNFPVGINGINAALGIKKITAPLIY
ncbi:MAG: hypothetical protein ACJA2G_000620, partial [Cognaticolwellia sp.]